MNKNSKSFCIYCSNGASRVIRFYAFKENLIKYKPKKLIYDGERDDIITKLNEMFGDDLILFNKNVKNFDQKRIHNSTSQFINKVMDDFSIEYLLCFGDKIIKKEFISSYPNRLINFHPAILPSFKGLKAINQALESKVVFLGNTAHFMDEGIDTGKIIVQTAMLTEEFEDYEDVLEMQFPMIKLVLRDILGYDVKKSSIMIELKTRKKRILIPEKCNL